MLRLLGLILLGIVGCSVVSFQSVDAVSSDPNHFVSADNSFYAYVKGGEAVDVSFERTAYQEQLDTPLTEIIITIDGPGIEQQKCVIEKTVKVGQGCEFDQITAPQTGVWRIQFDVPDAAKSYKEVSQDIKWGKYLYEWTIDITSGVAPQIGRVWSERYALRQPDSTEFIGDFTMFYISEDGYIYRSKYFGYNGQISVLSADSVGIRSGDNCESVYRSVDVTDAKLSPAYGDCGGSYKLFFEEPAGDLPTKATRWDDETEWIRPDIKRPAISELAFISDNSQDQQSGTVAFFLRNFVGQYDIKVDVDNDGSFDGQNDVVLHQQMRRLSDGLQRIRFPGVDKTGLIISPSQKIGIKVEITKVAEIHFVAADVEGRTGGIELVRLNGTNAPTTKICWNDTELDEIADIAAATEDRDGRNCPVSTNGAHGWGYSGGSWGNARYIEDWVYASARLQGASTIVFPSDGEEIVTTAQRNGALIAFISIVVSIMAIAGGVFIAIKKKQRRRNDITVSGESQVQQPMYGPQQPPAQSQNPGQVQQYPDDPPQQGPRPPSNL